MLQLSALDNYLGCKKKILGLLVFIFMFQKKKESMFT